MRPGSGSADSGVASGPPGWKSSLTCLLKVGESQGASRCPASRPGGGETRTSGAPAEAHGGGGHYAARPGPARPAMKRSGGSKCICTASERAPATKSAMASRNGTRFSRGDSGCAPGCPVAGDGRRSRCVDVNARRGPRIVGKTAVPVSPNVSGGFPISRACWIHRRSVGLLDVHTASNTTLSGLVPLRRAK